MNGIEKALVDRGLDVMSEEQAAFCFTLASGWAAEITVAGSSTRLQAVAPVEDWPAWARIKKRSVDFAVQKFEIMMGKRDEVYRNESLYPKIVGFFTRYSAMPKSEVLRIASDCLDTPDSRAVMEYCKVSNGPDLKDVQNLGKAVDSIAIVLAQRGMRPSDALRKALEQYAAKYELPVEKVVRIHTAWTKQRDRR